MTMTKLKKLFTRSRHDVDMTEGSIAGNLVRFALPLLVGNLFQQLYNMVDTWVIGQSGQDGAYAAVGSVGPIINILIGFFSGLATGAGVVISQYYGSKDEKRVHDTVHTSLAMTIVMAVLFTVLGIVMTPWILGLMLDGSTEDPTAVYPFAKTYLTIYFAGVTGLMIYNMCAGILRAVGDSRRPFYFLVVSAVTNTVLDLVFVFQFDMGVAGVAYATVIAQLLSAVLAAITLLRSKSVVHVVIRDIRFRFDILGQIIRVGIPAAIQMALTAFSNVFVQSYIGSVGNGLAVDAAELKVIQTNALAGWTTYSKVDQLLFLPLQTLALAITTFVGQNLGCGNLDRAKRGTRLAFLMALGTVIVFMVPIMVFAPELSAFFNASTPVVANAVRLLRCITPFYAFCCVNQIFSGAIRGAGNSGAPMIIMLVTFVGCRQIYLYVMANYICNELLPVGCGYPFGWFMCALVTFIYYKCFFRFDKYRLTAAKEESAT